MNDSIQFGSRQINFNVVFSNRKTLGITVKADLTVNVKAPVQTSIDKIKEKLIKKAPWILIQQSYFLSFEPRLTERKYISGETHLYLGKQYRLKIIESDFDAIKMKGQFLNVFTNEKEGVKQKVKNWYSDRARVIFNQLAEPLIESFKKYNVTPSSIVLREMPTRWGSCTVNGKIILNPELVKAPKGCIEYVIIHELCHLIHHDHTQKFIDLQTKEMKDWEKWKMKLEKLLA
jgi:predicted metal-dependent hydrolase